jgi:hypothetical protein
LFQLLLLLPQKTTSSMTRYNAKQAILQAIGLVLLRASFQTGQQK